MRTFATLLFASLLCAARADNGDSLAHWLRTGAEAYSRGEYAAALQAFEDVHAQRGSAGLLLNIGNCHFKLGDIPRAILFYERALRLDPTAEDVRANLDLARQQVLDRITEPPPSALTLAWSRLQGRDPDLWAKRALWCCLLLFTLLGLMLLPSLRRSRGTLTVLALLMAMATVASIAFAAARARGLADRSQAIIMATKSEALGEPREGATVLFALHKGSKVAVQQEVEGWCEVRLPNGSVGWMPARALERI